jgi:hypothetical protein
MGKSRVKTAKKKAARAGVSEKIRKLIKEGVPQKKAVATALSMKRAGRLGPKASRRGGSS